MAPSNTRGAQLSYYPTLRAYHQVVVIVLSFIFTALDWNEKESLIHCGAKLYVDLFHDFKFFFFCKGNLMAQAQAISHPVMT